LGTTRILVVDDEPVVADVVERYLSREGFRVSVAADGDAALLAYTGVRPHLVILDIMLPGIDGLEVCRRMRATGETPIIMLTARGDEMDRIAGFELGADDYLAKPFSPRELVARVKAVLRRSGMSAGESAAPLTIGDISIDPLSRKVTRGGAELALTQREFDLLWFFATHPDHVFSREILLQNVWGDDAYCDASTVTVHVRRVRTKIEADPQEPRHLTTVWGRGYRWNG
jgi:two-component system response regulator ResD